eukprot:2456832-Prorocentrum_lima.AAC.1
MRDREKDPLVKQALTARINEAAAELPSTKDPLDSLRDVLRVFNEITAARSRLIEELSLLDRQILEMQGKRSQVAARIGEKTAALQQHAATQRDLLRQLQE